MASIRKRGNTFVADINIVVDFKKIREIKSFESKAAAQMWALEREKELRAGRNIDLDRSKTLQDALVRYRDEVSIKKKGAKWEVIRINSFLRDESLYAQIKLQSLTTDFFGVWRESRNISDASKNREMAIMRAVLDTCRREWKWIDHNPLADLRGLKNPPSRNRRVSDTEIELLTVELGFDNEWPSTKKAMTGIMFLLAIETAMRAGEMVSLDWAQVNLKQRFLTLLSTKNGDKRDIPLSRRAIELLVIMGEHKQGRVFNITADSLSTTFRKAVRKCNIIDLTFHDSRHEACTRLAQKLNVLDLARMIGHRDPRSLMIYYNPTASELASKLD